MFGWPKRIFIAGCVAALVLGSASYLALRDQRTARDDGGGRSSPGGPPAVPLESPGGADLVVRPPPSEDPGAAPAGGSGEESRRSRRQKDGTDRGSGTAAVRGDPGAGDGAARKIDPRDIPPSAITDALLRQALRHSSAPLGEALRKALEGEERGPLLGLLIANLTEHGTRFTSEELPLLIEALKGAPGHEIQSLLLAHLDRMEASPEKTAAYLDYLKGSPSPSHAVEVVDRLAKARAPETVGGLLEVLEGGSTHKARRRIVEVLGEIGDPAAVGALARNLGSSEDAGERQASLRALAAIGDRSALEAILGHAAVEENRSALGILASLDARKDPDSVPLLAGALLDRTYPDFQLAILRKLARDGDPRIERTVQRAIDRSDAPKVQGAAADALAAFGTRDSLAYLQAKAIEATDPAARRAYERAARRIAQRIEAAGR
jgi:hypothetical protein